MGLITAYPARNAKDDVVAAPHLDGLHHTTRAVHIAGINTNPDSAFMAQVARNLTDHVDGFLRNKCYLIVDNAERPHQGIGNELIELATDPDTGEALARERLGGLLKHYHRSAA